ncbi:MAG: cytochrome c maturation protein CcmE [Promethearchaeota archaeon]|nr:MAG: cytochrome c maturation protein CcmE [Candidatus Lokiarchaeota archaeon]
MIKLGKFVLKSKKILGLIIVLASIIGLIIILAFNTRPFLTVSQVVNNAQLYDNQEIQVSGIVEELIGNEFYIAEGSDRIRVIPDNIIIPNDVYNGSEVVVQGEFNASNISMKVYEILTYCCDRSTGV